MKDNKVILFLKNYWYFSLSVIPFILLCINNKQVNNDIWFLMNTGRYILKNGFFYIDPFIIHKGFHIVVQQWLTSIILYILYKKLSKYGIIFFIFILFVSIFIIEYKICLLISNNRKKSYIFSVIALSLSTYFITSRPQSITYCILLLETYFLEKYAKNGDIKNLFMLPLLSLLLINFHASMWFLQFIFILPFLVNSINIRKMTIKKINCLPIIITLLAMFFISFINPYGLGAITYVFKSYGISEINSNIEEMLSPVFSNIYWYCSLILFIFFFINVFLFKKKLDIRFICFNLGLFMFASFHNKTVVYYTLWIGYLFSSFQFKKIEINNQYLSHFIKSIVYSSSICLIIIIIPVLFTFCKYYSMKTNYITNITKYMLNEYNNKDIILFINYNDGGYTEFYSIKSYMDPRAELFLKKFNKKKDIINEFVNINEDNAKDFLNKYNFTHLIVNYKTDSELFKYLDKNDTNYVLEYTEYFDNAKKIFPIERLYVRKDISVLNVYLNKKRLNMMM